MIEKRFGFLFQPTALWIGVHYSPHNRRFCINVLPCVTLWIIRKGGTAPLSRADRAAGAHIAECVVRPYPMG